MRPANESRNPNGETLLKEEYWACLAIPFLFWLFASLTISMGYYGAKSMVLGPNYSHIIKANPVLVNHIEVTGHQKGAVLYTFSAAPVLGCRSTWTENHTMLLGPDHHQEYMVWLNKGSKLSVSYTMLSAGFYSILMTVSQGYNRRRRWFPSHGIWHTVQAWKEVHSEAGNLEYEAMQDGGYFVVVHNLNQQPLAIELHLEVNATKYNTEFAYAKCSVGLKSCKVTLPIFENRFALLATDALENGTLSSEVELVFQARWISYFAVLAGLLLLVSTLLRTLNGLGEMPQEQAAPQDASIEDTMRNCLLSPKDENPGCDKNLNHGSIENHLRENVANIQQLCAICFDAPKTVFFIPCGHAATCLACAKRLRRHETGFCPLCRVKIDKIGRISK